MTQAPQNPVPNPTSVSVHHHISMMQIVSGVLCIGGGVLTFLQALPPNIRWVAPAVMFTSAGLAGLGMICKTWNSSQLPGGQP